MTAYRTVVLIDDHPLFRQGVRWQLESNPVFLIAGEGSTAAEAIALVDELSPDILVLDVQIPGPPAHQTIRRLLREHPDLRIVVLTLYDDEVLRRQLLHAGAAVFLTKTATTSELMTSVLSSSPAAAATKSDQHPKILTSREHEVLRMIAQAHTNRDIGHELSIAEATVKRHSRNLYRKLGATSRMDAVRRAALLGIL